MFLHGRPLRILVLDIDGVLTDGTVSTRGYAERRVHVRDLDAVSRAREAGIQVAFLTGESAEEAAHVVARCGGGAAEYGAKDKVAGLRKLAGEHGIEASDICYVADARRDAAALSIAGLGLVPADADPEAKRCAARVLTHEGGRGAVAEAVDILMSRAPMEQEQVTPSDLIRSVAAEAVGVTARFIDECLPNVEHLARLLTRALGAGGRVLLFGNGGSAAMAQHAATELVCRFRIDRPPLPAIALCSDTAVITAAANDWSFDEVFRRQILAHGNRGDAAVAMSTSGSSRNVLGGLEAARVRGLTTALLTGGSPDPIAARSCDVCLSVPSTSVARIQETHLLAWHLVCELIDSALVGRSKEAAASATGSEHDPLHGASELR